MILGSAGCTHNYYYGNAVPVCGPTTVPSTVANGAVCEVPTQVDGGSLVAQGAGRSTIVAGAPIYAGARPPRVVVSSPSGGSGIGRWQRANNDSSLARTRVEGALDDSTVDR
jgi:hypothetical protein